MRNAGTAGAYNAAGLPGLTGRTSLRSSVGFGGGAAGVFKKTIDNSLIYEPSFEPKSNDMAWLEFDASGSSTIYSASTTVMPESADMSVGLYLGCLTKV